MYVRKVKRKCSVRGCKCTDTFSISNTIEPGNTVIICASCLKAAAEVVDNPKPMPEMRVSPTEAPPLFFKEKVKKDTPEQTTDGYESKETDNEAPETVKSATDAETFHEEVPAGDETPVAETDAENVSELECPYCGQICKTESGLQKHIAAKHKDLI